MFVQSFQYSIQLQERLLEIQVHVQCRFLWGEHDPITGGHCFQNSVLIKPHLSKIGWRLCMRSCGLLPATWPLLFPIQFWEAEYLRADYNLT